MRKELLIFAALASVAFGSDEHLRRRGVNDQASKIVPKITPAPLAVEVPDLRKRQDALSSLVQEESILDVLATALPFSYFEIAITNPGAVNSILSADFASGQTPSWYEALPPDVKTYLATASGFLDATPTDSVAYAIPSISIPQFTDNSYLAQMSSLLAQYSITYSNPFLPAQTTASISGQASASSKSSAAPTAALSTQQKQSSGLSTGAKIGIGVGVPAAFLAIGAIAGVLLLISHKKKKQRNAANSVAAGNFEAKPVAIPPPQPQYPGPKMEYYPTGQVVELPPQSYVPELQSNQRPLYEMRG